MTQESRIVFLGIKSARIISSMVELFGIAEDKATDIFYKSETAAMIADGTADLYCRSEKYLATLVWEEYMETA